MLFNKIHQLIDIPIQRRKFYQDYCKSFIIIISKKLILFSIQSFKNLLIKKLY